MFNFKNIKILICSLFIFSIITLPIYTYADAVSDLGTNMAATSFMGPISVPAAFIATGLEALNVLPSAKTVGDLINPVEYVYSGIVMAAGSFMDIASNALLQTGQAILAYVIKGDFIGKSVTDLDSTSSTYNSTVAIGWGIVRNVANAALVIGLVIIAINIILGREENKAKKTLINFIIIALLINFTPVICGFIIDGSNILTNSFMSGGINNGFAGAIKTAYDSSWSTLKSDLLSIFLVNIVLLLFSLVAFFIYVMYALLFLARYVILMILVIASPVAFATKVFPQSKYIKKVFPSILYWDDWWESFIQWCVIGIPAGLFIYLSNLIMSRISYESIIITTATSNEGIVSSLIGGLFGYSVPLVVLIVGFFITISAGGQVGSYLGGVATGAWAATGGRAIGRAKELGWEGTTGTIGAMAQGKNPLSFENREEARLAIKEKVDNILPPDPSKDKEAAKDYLKMHPNAYNLRTRSSLQASNINKDYADDIDNAKTSEELETIARNATNYGSKKTKDSVALKLSGKRSMPGGEDVYKKFVQKNEIKIENKISGMNDRTAQKELGGGQLSNYDVFKNMNAGQITYIMKNGSEGQKKSLASNFGGGNSDFKAYTKDLYLKATDPNLPDAKALEEFKKIKENVLAIHNNKP